MAEISSQSCAWTQQVWCKIATGWHSFKHVVATQYLTPQRRFALQLIVVSAKLIFTVVEVYKQLVLVSPSPNYRNAVAFGFTGVVLVVCVYVLMIVGHRPLIDQLVAYDEECSRDDSAMRGFNDDSCTHYQIKTRDFPECVCATKAADFTADNASVTTVVVVPDAIAKVSLSSQDVLCSALGSRSGFLSRNALCADDHVSTTASSSGGQSEDSVGSSVIGERSLWTQQPSVVTSRCDGGADASHESSSHTTVADNIRFKSESVFKYHPPEIYREHPLNHSVFRRNASLILNLCIFATVFVVLVAVYYIALGFIYEDNLFAFMGLIDRKEAQSETPSSIQPSTPPPLTIATFDSSYYMCGILYYSCIKWFVGMYVYMKAVRRENVDARELLARLAPHARQG